MAPETKITIKILRIITIKSPAGDSQINSRRANRFTLGLRVYKSLAPAPHNVLPKSRKPQRRVELSIHWSHGQEKLVPVLAVPVGREAKTHSCTLGLSSGW